jgi:transcriptional regulator with XRE-family HTH domain
MPGNNGNHRPKRPVGVDGGTLTEARIRVGLSLEEVAKRLGRHRSTVSRWERGEQVPTAEDILKMMALYKADFRVIANGGTEK